MLVSLNPVPPPVGENTFNECPIVVVYVPSEAIEDYQSAEGWKDFYIVDVANKSEELVLNFTVDGINYRVSSLQYSRVEVVSGDNKYSGDIVIPEVVTRSIVRRSALSPLRRNARSVSGISSMPLNLLSKSLNRSISPFPKQLC
jgi:acetate kinase